MLGIEIKLILFGFVAALLARRQIKRRNIAGGRSYGAQADASLRVGV